MCRLLVAYLQLRSYLLQLVKQCHPPVLFLSRELTSTRLTTNTTHDTQHNPEILTFNESDQVWLSRRYNHTGLAPRQPYPGGRPGEAAAP